MSPGILSIAQLLNPEEENLDARQEIAALRQIPGAVPEGQQALVLPRRHRHLKTALAALRRNPPHPVASVALPPLTLPGGNCRIYGTAQQRDDVGAPVPPSPRVPQSSIPKPARQGLRPFPVAKCLPWKDFQYSHGLPGGAAMNGSFKYTQLLVNSRGEPVRCQIQHKTCLGVKACQYAHPPEGFKGHTSATLEDIERIRAEQRKSRDAWSSPRRDIFLKTAAYITAVLHLSCRHPKQEPTCRTEQEREEFDKLQVQRHLFAGAISPTTMRRSHNLSRGQRRRERKEKHGLEAQYDIDYIAAVFTGDTQALARIEEPAARKIMDRWLPSSTGSGIPLKKIARIVHTRWSLLKGAHTPDPAAGENPHGGSQGHTDAPEEPEGGAARHHSAPFLRHPARAIKEDFPEGTDWKGTEAIRLHQAPVVMRLLAVQRLKAEQDANLPEEEHYIRVILELDNNNLPVHEEDDEPGEPGEKTRIIICMSREGSRRLQLYGAYLQSDTGFKRIVGFDEFELAAMDRDANTSIIFCRVYITRHTAAAHQHIFEELERIVLTDTGSELRWRHLHATTQDETAALILHWTADQHRGQAKGLGLHLVAVAQKLPADRMDLYETDRLSDLWGRTIISADSFAFAWYTIVATSRHARSRNLYGN
ncbi:hypothetical protein B0H17DRAFT_1139059 [Mycena rosella]|uniref:Uncharacterized protein n=1 Tax=Mycena rosella TaxID=1033263 RepID=A0AAD7D5Q7_MYCRO|nr:hypothetical protein B0H17DRAFT_1139059 [Mycena rosella]